MEEISSAFFCGKIIVRSKMECDMMKSKEFCNHLGKE